MRSPTVWVGASGSRSGTTLATIPPDRRSVAVVRPDTGNPSTTSPAPVMAPRYAPKAATMIGAAPEDSRAATLSSRSAVALGNSADTRFGCAFTAASRPANVTGGVIPARCSRQYARSLCSRCESR